MMKIDAKIRIQNLTNFYTLILLKSRESITGYSILKRLEDDLGTKASPSTIYKFLRILKSVKYIEDVPLLTSKRAKGYRLTALGSEFVKETLMRLNGLTDMLIQSKLQHCENCDVQFYSDYYNEFIKGKEMIFCCGNCARAFKSKHLHS